MTNTDTVYNIVSNLSNSHSENIFNLDTAFVKNDSSILAEPLTYVIHLFATTGKFLDDWKTGLTASIFKSGEANLASNDRPISIFPIFSQVLKKVMAQQLITYLEINSLRHPNQFGIRAKHSTELAK